MFRLTPKYSFYYLFEKLQFLGSDSKLRDLDRFLAKKLVELITYVIFAPSRIIIFSVSKNFFFEN